MALARHRSKDSWEERSEETSVSVEVPPEEAVNGVMSSSSGHVTESERCVK